MTENFVFYHLRTHLFISFQVGNAVHLILTFICLPCFRHFALLETEITLTRFQTDLKKKTHLFIKLQL